MTEDFSGRGVSVSHPHCLAVARILIFECLHERSHLMITCVVVELGNLLQLAAIFGSAPSTTSFPLIIGLAVVPAHAPC